MSVDNYYPLLEDKDFNNKLQNHPEFYQFKYNVDNYTLENMKYLSEQKCSETGGYIYKKIQMFVSSFLSLNTPYNGILLYHGVGVGKSCSSILIADNFKSYVKKNNKKIIILTKKAVKDSFRNEIFEFNSDKIDKNEFKCTSNEYNTIYNDFIKNNPTLDAKQIKNFSEGIIDEYYEIYGYTEFTNKYDKLIKINDIYNEEKINNYFSNCVFIIDEIHNLRDEDSDKKTKEENNEDAKKSRIIIENIISNLYNPIKLILLSATPMYDKYEELEFIINLLLLNDKKDVLDKSLINNYVNTQNIDSYNILLEKTRGYISYIKGNDPYIFPLILYPTNNSKLLYETPDKPLYNDRINAVICPMNSYQKTAYLKAQKNDTKTNYSNIVFPKNKTFLDLFTKNKNNTFTFKDEELCNTLLSNIENYSIKVYNLLENINNSTGKIFIYTPNIQGKNAGTDFLGIILEYYGYFRKVISKNKLVNSNVLTNKNNVNVKGYYIITNGQTKEEDFVSYKNYYNHQNNINGQEIKIIIGTTNMIEGVSLKNVRQIHIMNPWYNMSRNEQIVGRGVRQCSHIQLPLNKRNITIFNYVATTQIYKSDKNQYIIPYYNNKQDLDIDLRTLQLATEKINKITLLEELLKVNSIDCILNKNVNTINIEETKLDNQQVITHIDSFNNKRLITYNTVDNYTCNSNLNPVVDNDYYNNQTEIFVNKNLKKNIKYFIKTIFTKSILRKKNKDKLITVQNNKIYYSYEELYNELLLYDTEINENIYKIVLQDLILNKEIFYDKFNKPGYIILNGQYFIFKNNIFENINLPLEFTNYPFNNKIKTIDNYKYYSVFTNLDTSKKTSETKTDKVSKTKTDKIKKKSDEENKVQDKPVTEILSENKQIINELLDICKTNNLIDWLKTPSVIDQYNKLWRNKLKPDTDKKSFGLIEYYVYEYNVDELSKTELYNSIFKILFKQDKKKKKEEENKKDKKKKKEEENKKEVEELYISNDLLYRFYQNYNIIHFTFNYSVLIITYLKCLFYRVHIKNTTLNNQEQEIYNNYSNLIVSTQPLIFKYIDFFKDELNIYSYENIGIVYYEYDLTNNIYITYNSKYNGHKNVVDTLDRKVTLYRIFPLLIDSKHSVDFVDKKFIMEQLNIDNFDYNRIYNSFNYNNYYNHNNTYFKYSGDPNNPFISKVSDTKKLSNIIGTIIINSSNSKKNLNDLSRNIFTLSTIYSIHNDNKNIYFKTGVNTGYTNITLPKKSGDKMGVSKIKHVLYCILDQVEELNYKLLLEIILEKNIDNLWDDEEELIKYKFKEILDKFDFKNPVLTEIQFNELNDLFDIINIDNINNNFKKYSYKFYTDCDSIYGILKHDLNETKLISLITYLLYDLDKYYVNDTYRSFYNKRWLFSLLESSLLNAKLLNITLMTKAQTNKAKSNRIGESASFTNNTFILSKALSKKEIAEYKELDK